MMSTFEPCILSLIMQENSLIAQENGKGYRLMIGLYCDKDHKLLFLINILKILES